MAPKTGVRRAVLPVVVVAVLAAVALVVVATVPGGHRHRPAAAPGAATPASTPTASRLPFRLPAPPPPRAGAGAVPFDWGAVRVWLPPAWAPAEDVDADRRVCTGTGFVALGQGSGSAGIGLSPCHDPAGAGSALTITPVRRDAPAGGRPARIDGISVRLYRDGTRVVVPSLDAVLTARRPDARSILATLQRSAADDLLGDLRRPPQVPASWPWITDQGIAVAVPPGAAVIHGVGLCPEAYEGPAARPPRPVVVEGPITGTSSCPGDTFPAVPVGDAVVVDGPAPAVIGPVAGLRQGGLALTAQPVAGSPGALLVDSERSGTVVPVELLIGPRFAAARQVLASLRAS